MQNIDDTGVKNYKGGKKIPELMKGLGKGVRSFKEGMNNMEKEIEEEPVKKE